MTIEFRKASHSLDREEVVCEHKRDDRHELHQNVEGGARGVLQGITNGIADHSRLVALSLLAEEWVASRVGLDELLGVVPGTTGVAHGHGELDAREEGTSEETVHSVHT